MHLALLRMTSKLSTENVYKNSIDGDADMKPVPNESWTSILLHTHAFLFFFLDILASMCNFMQFWPKMAKIQIFKLNSRPLNVLKSDFLPSTKLSMLEWEKPRTA